MCVAEMKEVAGGDMECNLCPIAHPRGSQAGVNKNQLNKDKTMLRPLC